MSLGMLVTSVLVAIAVTVVPRALRATGDGLSVTRETLPMIVLGLALGAGGKALFTSQVSPEWRFGFCVGAIVAVAAVWRWESARARSRPTAPLTDAGLPHPRLNMTEAQFTALCERMARKGLPVPASHEDAEREAALVLRRPEDSHEEWRARVAAVNAASGH